MRKLQWTALLLITTILVTFVPALSAAAVTFADVPTNAEYHKEVHYLANQQIVKGYTNSGKQYFKPADKLSRYQAAKMLVLAAGKESHSASSVTFTDVTNKNSEEYKFLSKAVSLGYFTKKADGSIKPYELIHRDEMAIALSKAFHYSKPSSTENPLLFTDLPANTTLKNAVNGLYYAGVANNPDNRFRPTEKLTRSQFALFVARAMNDSFKLPVSPPDQTASSFLAKVVTDGTALNIRSLPSTDGQVIGKLYNGQLVQINGKIGDWYKISAGSSDGYIFHSYIKEATTETPAPSPTPTPPSTTSGLIGKVTVNGLNVREQANATSAIVTQLSRGQKVEVLSINGYWANIRVNDKVGHVHKSYLKLINQSGNPLKDRIIVIDPGHGNHDPGANRNGLNEKDVVLKVSKLVEGKLNRAGAKVILTRPDDRFLELSERTDFAKKHFAEAFISIHVNAAASSAANGTEVFYDSSANPNAVESRSLATYIQNQIVAKANMYNRGVKDAKFYVIRNNNVAAVLVELGFISNAEDFKKLASDAYLEIYAEAIYQGIYQYYAAE